MPDRLLASSWTLAGLLAWSPAANAQAAPAASLIEESHACVQVALAQDGQGRVDLGQAARPRYRVGPRFAGEPCAQVPLVEVPAAQVAPLVRALRALGEQHDAGLAPLAGCDAITFAGQAPRMDGERLDLWLQACGRTIPVVATPTDGDDPGAALALQVGIDPATGLDPTAADAAAGPGWRRWWPDKLHLDSSLSRDDTDQTRDDEIKLRIDGLWDRGANLTRLELDSEIKRTNDSPWRREFSGRVRWFHDFPNQWFTLNELFAERDIAKYQGLSLDYLLLQASSGGGYRWLWKDRGDLRLALQWNRFYFRLLDYDLDQGLGAPSLFASGTWQLGKKLSSNAWARLYDWPDGGGTGIDLEAEMLYDLSRHVGFGLRWRYSDNAASVNESKKDETEVFFRYRF